MFCPCSSGASNDEGFPQPLSAFDGQHSLAAMLEERRLRHQERQQRHKRYQIISPILFFCQLGLKGCFLIDL